METVLTTQTPGALALLIDNAAGCKAALERLTVQQTALENQLSKLLEQIDAEMEAQHLSAAAGQFGEAEIRALRVYKMDSQMWNALHKHIATTGEFDLLHKRLNTTALREREKIGATLPPGVVAVVINKLDVKVMK